MTLFQYLFQAPTADWIRFLGFLVGIVFFILLAEKARHSMGWQPEFNRKLVHILTGVLIMVAALFFESGRPLIWMAIIFIGVNYAGIRTGKLKGMHGTARVSYGTVFYPLTFLILVLTCWPERKGILMIAMSILAISDAAAAIVGENIRNPHGYHWGKDRKSIEGSLVMLLTSWFLATVFLLVLPGHFFAGPVMPVTWRTALWIGAATAVVSTAMEALSAQGSDNLTAPLGAAFVLGFMLQNSVSGNIQFTAGLLMGITIAVLAYRVHFLTASGSVGTFLLAALVYGVGGWAWTVPILTFFILSSVLSKVGKKHKARFRLMFEKTSNRDIGQVIANGGVAGAVVLLHHFFPDPSWYALYLGALAAVTADTWATEVGVFSSTSPVSIKNFRRVEPGTSGGITLLGTVSAFMGALVIALSGRLAAPRIWESSPSGTLFWIIVTGGFLGSLLDSFLGATLQAHFQCPECRKVTEKREHCGGNTTLYHHGIHWLNNDWVNIFCAAAGVSVVFILREWIVL